MQSKKTQIQNLSDAVVKRIFSNNNVRLLNISDAAAKAVLENTNVTLITGKKT